MHWLVKTIMGLLGLVMLLAAAWGAKWMLDNPIKPKVETAGGVQVLVRVIELPLSEHQVTIKTQGTVEPRYRGTVSSEVSGPVIRVDERLVDGGWFLQGEEFLAIDPADFEVRVVQAEGNLAQAELNLMTKRARAEQAVEDWSRLANGKEAGALTLREPQVRAAEAAVATAKAELARARRDLAKTRVVAPYDCRVLERMVEPGSFVAAGREVVRIFSLDEREVRLPVRFADLDYLRQVDDQLDGKVVATAQVGGRRIEWQGEILRDAGEVDRRTLSAVLVANLQENREVGVPGFEVPPPGSFVEVSLSGRRLTNVLVLPRRAVRPDGRVMVVSDGRLRFCELRVLRAVGDELIVASGGESAAWSATQEKKKFLAAGDRVVVSSVEAPVDGMKVQVEGEGAKAVGQEASSGKQGTGRASSPTQGDR